MTLMLDLAPEQEAQLEEQAQAQGKRLDEYLHSVIAQLATPVLTAKKKAAIALLDAWREEDKTDDAEELERRDAELQAFKTNINANRAATGEEPIY